MIDFNILGLLSEPIRHYVCNKEWDDFRPIQKAAIIRIMQTDKNYILASRTASGKTEAAFLPVLSKVNFNDPGVQVLYISPLIALINDQLGRVLDLCSFMDVPVTKWHGEASASAKRILERDPRGVMLTTPESLEAMFVCHPERIRTFFGNLKYVIIDEIHYFIGSDRGLQLQSLLRRIQLECSNKVRFVGLSATIGDYNQAKGFMGNPDETKVLKDPTPKPIDFQFRFFEEDDADKLPIDLVKDIFRSTFEQKALVFPNNRRSVEELAVRMRHFAERIGTAPNYFAHHASIDKKVREEIEHIAKSSYNVPFTICCTSTLELGIDIGSVDVIAQVNSLYSIASMIQRAGRSGRKGDRHARMIVYATKQMSLVQSLACWTLHEHGLIDTPATVTKPYDVLVHQTLSIVGEKSEMGVLELIGRLRAIHIFSKIESKEIATILKHMINNDILEAVNDKIIVGTGGMKVMSGRKFYSMFTTKEMLQVFCNGTKIGEVQPSEIIVEGNNILLAASVWNIIEVDYSINKVFVKPATNGKPPKFRSDGAAIPEMVEREMFRLLHDDSQDNAFASVINETCKMELAKVRSEMKHWTRHNIYMKEERGSTILMPLCGSAINQTIYHFILMTVPGTQYDKGTVIVPIDNAKFVKILPKIVENATIDGFEKHLEKEIEECPRLIDTCSKFGHLLPIAFQAKIYAEKVLDPLGAISILLTIK